MLRSFTPSDAHQPSSTTPCHCKHNHCPQFIAAAPTATTTTTAATATATTAALAPTPGAGALRCRRLCPYRLVFSGFTTDLSSHESTTRWNSSVLSRYRWCPADGMMAKVASTPCSCGVHMVQPG